MSDDCTECGAGRDAAIHRGRGRYPHTFSPPTPAAARSDIPALLRERSAFCRAVGLEDGADGGKVMETLARWRKALEEMDRSATYAENNYGGKALWTTGGGSYLKAGIDAVRAARAAPTPEPPPAKAASATGSTACGPMGCEPGAALAGDGATARVGISGSADLDEGGTPLRDADGAAPAAAEQTGGTRNG